MALRPGSNGEVLVSLRISMWPAWAVALGVCVVGAAVYVALELLQFPDWLARPRVVASMTVLIAAVLYAGLVSDSQRERKRNRISQLHLAPAGAVAGIACAVLFNAVSPEIFMCAAFIGAVLASLGVFGFVARHM